MPTLKPCKRGEFLSLARYGLALSRFGHMGRLRRSLKRWKRAIVILCALTARSLFRSSLTPAVGMYAALIMAGVPEIETRLGHKRVP